MSTLHKRILMAVTGSILAAIAIGFFKAALFGTDPYQTFAAGLNAVLIPSLHYGTFFSLLNLTFVVGIFFIDRRHIGLVTIMSMLLTGHIIEATRSLLTAHFANPDLFTRILFLVFAILVLCFSVSLYFTADLGVSAYDAVARIISEKKGWDYKYVRITTDLICMTIGFACGARVGIATIITAFCMGPLIDYFKVHFSQPLLRGTLVRAKRRPKLG